MRIKSERSEPKSLIGVLLVESDPVVREGLRSWLGASGRLKIVGGASNVEEGLRQSSTEPPDIVIVGLKWPAEATGQIREKMPASGVVVFTRQNSAEEIRRCIKAGARAYVLKSSRADDLVRAVEAVHDGEEYFDRAVSAILADDYVTQGEPDSRRVAQLTRREIEVLKLIADGSTNKEIADKLGLSIRTVETHREHIMQKLNIHTAARLTKYAIARGLVDIAESDFD